MGVPATFELCQKIIAPGGTIANIGVHGVKVDLHLEELWDRNVTITTRRVDTVSTPMLLKSVNSQKIDPGQLITHRFKLDQIVEAYETFRVAARTKALKAIIEASAARAAAAAQFRNARRMRAMACRTTNPWVVSEPSAPPELPVLLAKRLFGKSATGVPMGLRM